MKRTQLRRKFQNVEEVQLKSSLDKGMNGYQTEQILSKTFEFNCWTQTYIKGSLHKFNLQSGVTYLPFA